MSQLPEHVLTSVMPKVLSPRLWSLISLGTSNRHLSSRSCHMLSSGGSFILPYSGQGGAARLFPSSAPLTASGWGRGCCRNKQAFWHLQLILKGQALSSPIFPLHKHCCAYHNTPTSLLTSLFPMPGHPKP